MKYDDIINLPRPVSKNHPRMSRIARAAQFAPFAALTGYDACVEEAARLTDRKFELSEEEIQNLNDAFRYIIDHINECPEVEITYFIADEKKDGGRYEDIKGKVRKINPVHRTLEIGDNKTVINFDDIVRMKV